MRNPLINALMSPSPPDANMFVFDRWSIWDLDHAFRRCQSILANRRFLCRGSTIDHEADCVRKEELVFKNYRYLLEKLRETKS